MSRKTSRGGKRLRDFDFTCLWNTTRADVSDFVDTNSKYGKEGKTVKLFFYNYDTLIYIFVYLHNIFYAINCITCTFFKLFFRYSSPLPVPAFSQSGRNRTLHRQVVVTKPRSDVWLWAGGFRRVPFSRRGNMIHVFAHTGDGIFRRLRLRGCNRNRKPPKQQIQRSPDTRRTTRDTRGVPWR